MDPIYMDVIIHQYMYGRLNSLVDSLAKQERELQSKLGEDSRSSLRLFTEASCSVNFGPYRFSFEIEFNSMYEKNKRDKVFSAKVFVRRPRDIPDELVSEIYLTQKEMSECGLDSSYRINTIANFYVYVVQSLNPDMPWSQPLAPPTTSFKKLFSRDRDSESYDTSG